MGQWQNDNHTSSWYSCVTSVLKMLLMSTLSHSLLSLHPFCLLWAVSIPLLLCLCDLDLNLFKSPLNSTLLSSRWLLLMLCSFSLVCACYLSVCLYCSKLPILAFSRSLCMSLWGIHVCVCASVHVLVCSWHNIPWEDTFCLWREVVI